VVFIKLRQAQILTEETLKEITKETTDNTGGLRLLR